MAVMSYKQNCEMSLTFTNFLISASMYIIGIGYCQNNNILSLQPGSHPSRADLQKAALGSSANLPRNPSEPNWYGNNIYYDYEDEVAKERLEFTRGLRQYSTKSEPPTLQLSKKRKDQMSDSSSSSGIDTASQGANGYDGENRYNQRL